MTTSNKLVHSNEYKLKILLDSVLVSNKKVLRRLHFLRDLFYVFTVSCCLVYA